MRPLSWLLSWLLSWPPTRTTHPDHPVSLDAGEAGLSWSPRMHRKIFHDSGLPPQKMKPRAGPFYATHRRHFSSPRRASAWLRYTFMPADGAWVFKPNGKTGTTSTLYFLFHLTTGHPLSAGLIEPSGLNEDQAGHALAEARIFSSVLARRGVDPAASLAEALRITTVRHPLARAVSGFRYLCRSDALKSAQFATERLRMTALTGFDWDRDAGTAQGFLRFLEYLSIDLAHHPARPVNSHFRPQVLNILPEVFRPGLVGRCEDLPAFFRALAARLDRPVPDGALEGRPRNRQPGSAGDVITPEATRLAAGIFAADFERFGYDV